MIVPSIGVSNFVRRQTPESPFSHFTGTWEQLLGLVKLNLHKALPGYRDGVLKVPVGPANFFSGEIEVTPETKLQTTFEARQPGEDAFLLTRARGPKMPARHVEIILYRKDVLVESGDAVTGCEWDIVCIRGYPTTEPSPMDPLTMARNFLQLTGGTKGDFSADDFAKSIVYWARHCMTEPLD